MGASEASYRLYNCARCAQQVRICRDCDRGNRYCAGGCAGIRRREALLRAGRRYQRSYRGACRHAARQSNWRKRQAQKVTHQGCLLSTATGTVVADSTQRSHAHDDRLLEPQSHSAAPVALAIPAWHGQARCSVCRRVLPSFARLGPLRGGP